jgi:hypothetical protein
LPFNGKTQIAISPEKALDFGLAIRIPNWAENLAVSIAHEEQTAQIEKGYLWLDRRWEGSSEIVIEFELPVRRQFARYEVEADRGRVALTRGPIVYCLESVENGANLDQILIPHDAKFSPIDRPDLLDGVTVLEGDAVRETQQNETLYSTSVPRLEPAPVIAVPYFAWDNREPGEMQVWSRSTMVVGIK